MRKYDRSGPRKKEPDFWLVKYKDNWADEMDLDGFRVMDKKELDEFVKNIGALKNFPFEVYFGTNQGVEFESVKDIMKAFKFVPLTTFDMQCLKQFFPEAARWGYGMFPEFEE